MSIKRTSSWYWRYRKREAIDISKTGFSRTKGLGLVIVHTEHDRKLGPHTFEQVKQY